MSKHLCRFEVTFKIPRLTPGFKLPSVTEYDTRTVYMEARNHRRAKKKIRSVLKEYGLNDYLSVSVIKEIV